jgi:hypothetical protein
MLYSLIMWLMLQVNQYFETSVPNKPSHWEVIWIEDVGWNWVFCSHALEYFLAKIFATPMLVVLHLVLG